MSITTKLNFLDSYVLTPNLGETSDEHRKILMKTKQRTENAKCLLYCWVLISKRSKANYETEVTIKFIYLFKL